MTTLERRDKHPPKILVPVLNVLWLLLVAAIVIFGDINAWATHTWFWVIVIGVTAIALGVIAHSRRK